MACLGRAMKITTKSSPRKLSRLQKVYGPNGRIPVGKSTFYRDFVNTGRIKLVHISPRSVAVVDDELDVLVDELIAERDANKQTAK
jgi:hypothetical protein